LFLLQTDEDINKINQDKLLWIKSKKVDDFSVSYWAGVQTAFFGIPALPEYIDIIESYKCSNATFWFFDLPYTRF
jgi:hypothetical protein